MRSGGGGKTSDEVVSELADELLEKLPPALNAAVNGDVMTLAEDAPGFAAPLHVIHIRIHVIICHYKTFGM